MVGQKIDLDPIRRGYELAPECSHSLHKQAYVSPQWLALEQSAIFAKSWQWVCHVEKLREAGSYVAAQVAGQSICIVRDKQNELRAFLNVCKHRAHELLQGEGKKAVITCPYHAWVYDLTGQLIKARNTENLVDFDLAEICLDQIKVEVFCGFVYVNLDNHAQNLASSTGNLADEIKTFAPDIENLTFSTRLTYTIQSNWKNVVDNFLECYHCPVAHKDFCTLVDMDSYTVTTHGLYSSHMAKAGNTANSAYSVQDATVKDHAVWWLWPNSCLMRYPGRGNFIVMQITPISVDQTFETYDFFFESAEPNTAEQEAIRYIDEVLQAEDIALVESVQRGMRSPGFNQGRIVHDPNGSGNSEHAVHHFHGLVLNAYEQACQS